MLSRFNMSDHQWKTSDRNSSGDLLSDQSDRKITRNQKRRHDEINHIQKVRFSSSLVYQHNSMDSLLNRYLLSLPDIRRDGSHNSSSGKGTRGHHKSEIHRSYPDWQIWDWHVVFQSIPRWIWKTVKTVDMWILLEVHAARKNIPISHGK